jgi:hypothetical protein
LLPKEWFGTHILIANKNKKYGAAFIIVAFRAAWVRNASDQLPIKNIQPFVSPLWSAKNMTKQGGQTNN